MLEGTIRYRLHLQHREPFESDSLHDIINRVRQADPVWYEIEATELATTADGARWFTLVPRNLSRYRS
jgi:hypothetical protein